jgi:hypothetical protein
VSDVFQRRILFCGRAQVLACDGRCGKAWGINGRPRHYFVDEEADSDDYVWFTDDELGRAPLPGHTVGVSEGGDCKPYGDHLRDVECMNRWCARECERSVMVDIDDDVRLPDMNDPRPNCAHRSMQDARDAAAARKAKR